MRILQHAMMPWLRIANSAALYSTRYSQRNADINMTIAYQANRLIEIEGLNAALSAE